ncbi:hypothetical protein F5Y09DRAFT_307828 [Xylaria sp. FL1042]|nr:hypothetical protein F5Y09DRAFT_307828 [Xylaria sp. FL1042]
MHSSKVLLSIAAVAGTSLAQQSDSAYCTSLRASFLTAIIAVAPTTPADILSFIATATPTIAPLPTTGLDFNLHASQLCQIAAELPASKLPEFQSFAQDLLSVGKSFSDEIVAYITECEPQDEIAIMTSKLNYYFTATGNVCETTPTPTPTGSSNGTYPISYSSPASTSMVVTAAAARPTGALLGAAAVGGALGAAAML